MDLIRPKFRAGTMPSASGLDSVSRAIYEVRSGRGINAQIDGGRLFIESRSTNTTPCEHEFERVQLSTTSIKFRAGHYYAVGSTRTLCDETTFDTLTTNGTFAIYAKFTYGSAWATNVVGGVTTILHKSTSASVPSDDATQRVIILQEFTVADNIISSIAPQEWTGAVWCYDIGACTT